MKRIFIFFISFFSYINLSYAQGEFKLSHNLDLPIGDYALHVDSNSLQLLQIPFFGLDLNFYSTPHIGDFISQNNTNWLINIQDYSNNINDLCRDSDIAMHQAKQKGKNRIQYFKEYMKDVIITNYGMGQSLKEAVNKNQ